MIGHIMDKTAADGKQPHDETCKGLRVRAERLGTPLPPLLVAAERVAATVTAGLHGRRRVGPGETFWQFRHYQSGDPVRSIDWRRSARSDSLYVCEHEWQAAQSVWLWCDGSPSMAYHAQATLPTKGERAALLCMALAVLLMRAGERVALLGSAPPPPPPGRNGPAWERPRCCGWPTA